MTLAQLREKLKADRTKLSDLRGKAAAEGATPEDRAAYKAGVKACQDTLDLIKDAEEEERIDAQTSKAADAPAGGGEGGDTPRIYASAKLEVPKESKALLGVAAMAKSALIAKKYGEIVSPEKLLEHDGYGAYAKEQVVKAAAERALLQKAGIFSTVSSSVLLPQPVAREVIPILYPETTFLQGNPTRRRLEGGRLRIPRGTGSATAAYVAEGAKKPIGALTFGDINMLAHKLAGIVYFTNEAAKWPVIDLEAYIRTELPTALGLKMDSAMYFATGGGANPTGIFNQAGITTVVGTFADPKAPTVGEIDRETGRMILALVGANLVRSNRWRWVMGHRARQYLADLRDGNGNAIYPTIESNGTFKGIPILVSNQFLENGGATTDEGLLGLVDFSQVIYAEEEGMTMKASTEATLDDGGTTVMLWQQNMAAILCEMEHDVALMRPQGVAKMTIRWGAP